MDAAGFGPAFLVSGVLMGVAALAWTPVMDTLKRPDVDAVPTGSVPVCPTRTARTPESRCQPIPVRRAIERPNPD